MARYYKLEVAKGPDDPSLLDAQLQIEYGIVACIHKDFFTMPLEQLWEHYLKPAVEQLRQRELLGP